MTPGGNDPLRDASRWLAADRDGRDADADAAFASVFRVVPQPATRPGFADRVIEALARDAARRRRRARIAVVGGIAASVLGALGAIAVLVAKGPSVLVGAVNVVVWMSAAFENGLDLWGVASQIGSTAASVIATPQVTSALIAIEAVGAAALYGLHRILSSEQESSR